MPAVWPRSHNPCTPHLLRTTSLAVTATDSDGNKFELEKVPGSDSTQTVRFASMYVKGGAPTVRPREPPASGRPGGGSSVATVPARTATPWGPTSGWAPTARAPLHLPFPRPAVVKEGRVVGCQARPERLNVYVVQMFGPDQAVRDKSGNRDWAKPFTWCVRHHTTGATAEHAHVPACLLACLPACLLAFLAPARLARLWARDCNSPVTLHLCPTPPRPSTPVPARLNMAFQVRAGCQPWGANNTRNLHLSRTFA